ncbi:MAG: aldo/keto reductase [Candidatus Hydrogenedentes bacterium]|nr:aldo/keto reductase [Candidatus Hydrogenedentota bacterium]
MKTYHLANTDLEVSRIAYGCMALGGSWDSAPFGDGEVKRAIDLVSIAVEAGINFFDHADIYARGKSEEVFAEVLRALPGLRERIVIQSKCGIRFPDTPEAGTPGRYDFSHDHIVGSAEAILGRLGIEQLDILLLHRPDPLMEPDEVARAFEALHGSGKVRYFGVSNFSASQVTLLQRSVAQPLVVNQLEISLLHHHLISEGIGINQTGYTYAATTGTLDYCRLHDLRVQAWTPVARGQIFEPADDAPAPVRAVAAMIGDLAESLGTSREAIALAWLLRHPAGIQPVVGTSSPERLRNACKADGVELSREAWYGLLEAVRGKPAP